MRAWGRALLATIVVAVLPAAIVWALWDLGYVTSMWVAAPLAVALALLASAAGGAYWKRRPATGDVLFGDLLLWGWLRRVRAERRLADAVELLRRTGAEDEAEKLRLLQQLASALDAKDPYLDGHSHRVARYSSAMAHRLGVSPEDEDRIRTAAAIHDVGKLHVPAELLGKPDKLTAPEEEEIHRHADEGAAMVACIGDPGLSSIVRHHHERFDGRGYPAGLRGVAIPLGARIVAVADTFDAVTSARPYRPAGTHKQALDVLAAEAGTQLDPVVVRAFRADYAHRRGLALWALLTLPITKARHAPLPAGLVVGGIVILGVAGTVVRVGGTAGGEPRAQAAQSAPVQMAGPARRTPAAAHHRRATPGRPARTGRSLHAQRPARAHATTASRTHGTTTVASTVTRRSGTTRPGTTRPGTTRPGTTSPNAPHAIKPRPVDTPGTTVPVPSTPRPPATPAAPSSPPATTTLPSTPAPPATQPVPTQPPATHPTADQCKKGGYTALGYPNQGQCVAASHH